MRLSRASNPMLTALRTASIMLGEGILKGMAETARISLGSYVTKSG